MWIGDLNVRAFCFTCTVDTRHKPPVRVHTQKFQFQGEEWRLYYYYRDQHVLGLENESRTGVATHPFAVSVQLECGRGGGTGRIRKAVPQVTRFTNEFEIYATRPIWVKEEEDILLSVPEFRRHAILKFTVVIKSEGGDLLNLADFRSTTTQTEDSGESLLPTASTASIQTECHLPDAAGTAATSLLRNTPDCLESLSQDFSKMLDHGSELDVEFQCSGQSTGAHGAVVSARSEVIASMLASGMVEGRTRVVKIPNMEPDVFRHFLRYIYTGSLPELTPDLALDLYEAGDQYAVIGLARRCSKFLLDHLTVDNACRVLVVADAHSDEAFRESVIGFVLERQVPLSGADWREFCRAHSNLANEVLNRFCLKLSQR